MRAILGWLEGVKRTKLGMVLAGFARWLDGVNRWAKLGLVLGGYVLALAACVVATAVYDWSFSAADHQTMGGMIAGGAMMYGAGLGLVLAAAPTALALWFVRRHRRSWEVFTGACLAFAAVGVVAALRLMVPSPELIRTPPGMFLSLLGLAQMLGAPIWTGGFALFAWLAPQRDLRRRMLLATAIEVVIGVCALVHFLPAFLPAFRA